MKAPRTFTAAAATFLITGCASIAVTDQAIVDRTASALALSKNDFTISNSVDDGVTTRYQVRAKTGQNYNCLVSGSIGLLGRAVSEAVCSKEGEAPRNPLLGR